MLASIIALIAKRLKKTSHPLPNLSSIEKAKQSRPYTPIGKIYVIDYNTNIF